MSLVAGLIDQLAIGLYVLLGVIFVWYVQKWSNARFDLRSTAFELERDYARTQIANAATVIVLVVQMAVVVLGVQRVVVPQVREDNTVREAALAAVAAPVLEDGDFVTPTRPAPQNVAPVDPVDPAELGGSVNQDIIATPTNTPTLVGTIEPNAPEVRGCETDNANIEIPANGMRVFEVVPVVGTAFVDNFTEYRIEIRGEDITDFRVVSSHTIPVRERSALAQFDPFPYENGTYQLQVMVFDTTTQLRASCQVTIYITDRPSTSTPVPTVQPGAQPAFATEIPAPTEAGDPLAP